MKNNIRRFGVILKYITGTLILILANAIYIVCTWVSEQFPNLDFSSIMFHLKVPLEGSNNDTFTGIIIRCLILAPIPALIGLIFAIKGASQDVLVLQIKKIKLRFPLNFWQKLFPLCSCFVLLCSIVFNSHFIGVDDYLRNQRSSSKLYETYYVDPQTTTVTFPEKKRNLIYIFMESMENTYSSPVYGGMEYDNFIPEMTQLQLENTNFSITADTLNGGISPSGTTWTMAAMVAQTAGVPLNIPIDGNSMDSYSTFLPGAYSIGEILESAGYQQEFLLGSDITFGGRKLYMTQHGNYTLKDYNYAIEEGLIPSDYHVFWGYEDEKLYSFAKEELETLSSSDQPFNLTLLTVDTHFIGGYYCDLCQNTYGDDQYANVIACASRQLADFISWVQEQPFYENTTIVIAGDHPTMDTAYIEETIGDAAAEYQRTVYTVVINPACEYVLGYDRTFTTFDLYPTTLASLGAEIEGDHLALGTNLFADIPTLAEELGIEEFDRQLCQTSAYYSRHLLFGD